MTTIEMPTTIKALFPAVPTSAAEAFERACDAFEAARAKKPGPAVEARAQVEAMVARIEGLRATIARAKELEDRLAAEAPNLSDQALSLAQDRRDEAKRAAEGATLRLPACARELKLRLEEVRAQEDAELKAWADSFIREIQATSQAYEAVEAEVRSWRFDCRQATQAAFEIVTSMRREVDGFAKATLGRLDLAT